MWCRFRAATIRTPKLSPFYAELLETVTRSLIITVSGMFVCWAVGYTVLKSGDFPFLLIPVLGLGGLTTFLSLRLLPKQVLLSQVIWLAGYILAVTFALFYLNSPEITLLYILAPLMAIALIGWQGGLFALFSSFGAISWYSIMESGSLYPSSNLLTVLFSLA